MNLYLLLAIALGAVAGTTEVPVARPAFAAVVARSSVRAERQVVRQASAALLHSAAAPRGAFVVPQLHSSPDEPLSGASTPRAPTA